MTSIFQMGPKTLAVPMTLFRNNRQKVVNELLKHPKVDGRTYVLLEGGKSLSVYDTDVDYIFRQESYFNYLFGVKEPGCYGAIHVMSGTAVLFMPHLPEDYAIWMGRLHTLEDFKVKYEVDDVLYADKIAQYFEKLNPSQILTLSGDNTDSGLKVQPALFAGIEKFILNCDILFPIIAECRVLKSKEEIEVLRYVAKVSSDAHKEVMKSLKPGMCEYEGESIFLHHCYSIGGCRHVSYTCICGSGINSAILHYGHASAPNDRAIENGDMCLFDMGANYCGYAADITCSFPINGKFTADQKFIYNVVLDARNAVLEAAKPGVSWVEMHTLANKVMLKGLKDGGILTGTVEEMFRAGLAAIFQPHGLGHLIGLDVHDVGGYLDDQPRRPVEPGLNKLRFARILKSGMYVTVEPGCYFIECLMNKALSDASLNQFINKEVFERFRNFGGVRIEDDVLITTTGNENFTIVPRTVEEIEAWMASKI